MNLIRLIGPLIVTFLYTLRVLIESWIGRTDRYDRIGANWSRWVLRTAGVRIRAIGKEGLDESRKYIYVSNHLSNLDIPAFGAVNHEFPKFVAKKEMLDIPAFGKALQGMGHIIIDRKNREQAHLAIEEAGRLYAGKSSVYFFAEGTRSLTGQLGPFKKGAFVYALASGQPILPLAVRGGRHLLPRGAHYGVQSGPMEVIYGQPIETTGLTQQDLPELMQRVRDVIESLDPGGKPDF